MTPRAQRTYSFSLALTAALLACLSGCNLLFLGGDKPELEEWIDDQNDKTGKYIGDLAAPYGLNWQKVESVALVTQLEGTGSNPAASAQKQRLLQEMLAKDVDAPNEMLAHPNTSMALVVGYLKPGIQVGDSLDVEVYVRSRSDTTSLRGGFLLPTRLRPMQVMGGAIQTGHEIAEAEGPIIIDAVFEGTDDPMLLRRGRVLGGGISKQSRTLGLAIYAGNQSIRTSGTIAKAINLRFDAIGGRKSAANPKTHKFVEIRALRQYRHNLSRYLKVLRSIVVVETAAQRVERIESLRNQLAEPTTAHTAAIRLEAIGKEAESTLLEALQSEHFEVQFYAAEALAYLDNREAVRVLTAAAGREPAFRYHAITALAAMTHVDASEGLVSLFNASSAETRFGAFRALRILSPGDPIVRGELLGGRFYLNEVPISGEPMIHFSRTRRPEVVLFGTDIQIRPVDFLYAGKDILIKLTPDGRLRVSRFFADRPDRIVVCDSNAGDLIRAIVSVGGTYGDVLAAIQSAKQKNILPARLSVNAQPRPGRTYRPDSQGPVASNPLPEMFTTPTDRSAPRGDDEYNENGEDVDDEDASTEETDEEEGEYVPERSANAGFSRWLKFW